MLLYNNICKQNKKISKMTFLENLKNSYNPTVSQEIYIKFLFFLMIFIAVYEITKKINFLKSNKGAQIIVSITTALLGSFYIKMNLITNFLLIPYNLLSLIVLTLSIFIIFFLITLKLNSLTRRLLWALYLIFYTISYIKNFEIQSNNPLILANIIISLILIVFDKFIYITILRRIR